MPVRRTGDWAKARAVLGNSLGPRMVGALRAATVKNALLLVPEIQRGIKSQASGGVPFANLAESTIDRKGSSKALTDTGFLVNAITQKIMADKALVGLLRGTVNPQGLDVVNIGAVMEYGGTIHQRNGAAIIIPARPFLHPVMEQYHEKILENYRDALHGQS